METENQIFQPGLNFFDHMLDQIMRHGNMDLTIKVNGDLAVDEHHTIEDTGIVLGEAILKALGKKKGIERYGFCFRWMTVFLRWLSISAEDRGWYGMLRLKEKNWRHAYGNVFSLL